MTECLNVFVCVCVCERERERVCVCVRVGICARFRVHVACATVKESVL